MKYFNLTKKEENKSNLTLKKLFSFSPSNLEKNQEEAYSNEEQNLFKSLTLEGKSIFLTGSAGTGKSFVLKEVIKVLQGKYGWEGVGITSMTGTGASIIGGVTLHHYLGIGVLGNFSKEVLLTKINRSKKIIKNWNKTKVLIIDEISMLDGDLFDKLEEIAREIRKNNRPFGGIQLILTGDFCQLPPAGKTVLFYTFEARNWIKCIDQIINLKKFIGKKAIGSFLFYKGLDLDVYQKIIEK